MSCIIPINGDFVHHPGTILDWENYAICVQGIDTSNLKRLPIAFLLRRYVGGRCFLLATIMKDFSNASFPPEVISVMEVALDAAVATLPEPVHSGHVQAIAEAILRAAHGGERDPIVLQRLALLELQLTKRDR